MLFQQLFCYFTVVLVIASYRMGDLARVEALSRAGREDDEIGRLPTVQLGGKIYSCKRCHTHLALSEDIVSKSFYSSCGKAYLFDKVVNVSLGKEEKRMMLTGIHTVADVFCIRCQSILGWKYIATDEESQKYKVGKFVLERCKLLGSDEHNSGSTNESQVGGSHIDDAWLNVIN